MSKRMTMGAACVFAMAACAGGSAAAAPLTGFAGTLDTAFARDSGGGSSTSSWLIDGAVAGPLGAPNLNFQVDVSGADTWGGGIHTHGSLDFGGNLFWAGNDGRIGIRGEYNTVGHGGNIGIASAFGEWYAAFLTPMVKAGYANTSGSGFGGRGGLFGVGLAAYVMPDLALTPSFTYSDIVSGQGCQLCGRGDVNTTSGSILAEFLLGGDPFGGLPVVGGIGGGVSIFGSYTYNQIHEFGVKTHDNVWMVGIRLYTGAGSLMDHHRNGTLNTFFTNNLF